MLTLRNQPPAQPRAGGLRVGDVLQGTYEVVRLAGSGGMGEVYEARHLRIPGRFAIKVLHREDVPDAESLARFRREAEVTSSLRHPNIVQVLDFNQLPDGTPYIVMEFLDGCDLGHRLDTQGRLPPFEVARHVSQLASALAAAHARGVVHRDLKPQNVLLVPMEGQLGEFVKIVDFGISTVRGGQSSSGERSLVGTPEYMSPEQANGDPRNIDESTDQFALAVMTQEMLTGEFVFTGETVATVLYRVVNEPPPPLPAPIRATVGHLGEAALRRAMAKRREDRFPGVLEFAAAFQEAVLWGGATPTPVAISPAVTAPDPATVRGAAVSRRRHQISLAVLALVAAGGWVTALTSPRAVEDRLGSLTGPLIEDADRLRIATRPSQLVYVNVAQAPPGLRAFVDDHPTPLPITLPRGTAAYRLRFEAPGHDPQELWADAVTDRVLDLSLRRHPR